MTRRASWQTSALAVLTVALVACNRTKPSAVDSSPSVRPATVAPNAVGDAGSQGQPVSVEFRPPGLADLPKDAVVYGTVKLELVSRVAAMPGLPNEQRQPLKKVLNERIEPLGIDGSQPVLFAIVSPPKAASGALLETAIMSSFGENYRAARREYWEAIVLTVVVPLAERANPRLLAEGIAKTMELEGVFKTCPDAQVCTGFRNAKPLGVVSSKRQVVAFHASPGRLRMDLVVPLVHSPVEARAMQELDAAMTRAGGPTAPDCQFLDTTALASVCVNRERAGELGAVLRHFKTLGLFSPSAAYEPAMSKIAREALDEARSCGELARPSLRELEDGTVSIYPKGPGLRLMGSWASPTSHPGLEKSFDKSFCGPLAGVMNRVSGALSGPGTDATDSKRAYRQMQECGWASYLVLVAGSWTSFVREKNVDLPAALRVVFGQEQKPADICARFEANRFIAEHRP